MIEHVYNSENKNDWAGAVDLLLENRQFPVTADPTYKELEAMRQIVWKDEKLLQEKVARGTQEDYIKIVIEEAAFDVSEPSPKRRRKCLNKTV